MSNLNPGMAFFVQKSFLGKAKMRKDVLAKYILDKWRLTLPQMRRQNKMRGRAVKWYEA